MAAGFSFDFNFLIDYLWKMERALDSLREEEEEKSVMMDPRAKEFRSWFEGMKHDWVFPTSLRYSFISLLYTHLELKLQKACDNLFVRDGLPIRERDLKGGPVARSRVYLTKFGGIPEAHVLWTEALELADLRNCVVHTGGRIDISRDKTRLEQLISASDQLDIATEQGTGDRYLVVREGYTLLKTKAIRDALESALFHLSAPEEWDEHFEDAT